MNSAASGVRMADCLSVQGSPLSVRGSPLSVRGSPLSVWGSPPSEQGTSGTESTNYSSSLASSTIARAQFANFHSPRSRIVLMPI